MSDLPIPELDVELGPIDDLDIDLNTVVTNYQAKPDEKRRKLLKPVPDEPGNYYLEIDHSSLNQFCVCQKSAENYLVFAREAASPAAALSFGTAIHKAMDVRLRYGLNTQSEQRMFEVVLNHFAKFPQPPDEYRTADRAIRELKKYNKEHPEPDVFKVVEDDANEPMVEIPFNFPLFTLELDRSVPYRPETIVENWDTIELPGSDKERTLVGRIYIIWTGRIDAVIWMDKQYWILDHKTTSIGGPKWPKQFELANQMRGYTWASRKLTGLPIAGMFLNGFVVRPPAASGNITSDIVRARFPYRDDQIDEWHSDTKRLITNFIHALCDGHFPQETEWCYGKYGKCQYHDACSMPKHQRPETLGNTFFREVTWSPLNVRD